MEPTYHSGDERFDLKPVQGLFIRLGVLCLDQAPGLLFTSGQRDRNGVFPTDTLPREEKLCSAFGLTLTIDMLFSGAKHKFTGKLILLGSSQLQAE